MQGAGSALMGIGSATGEGRAITATEEAIASPLLETSIDAPTVYCSSSRAAPTWACSR